MSLCLYREINIMCMHVEFGIKKHFKLGLALRSSQLACFFTTANGAEFLSFSFLPFKLDLNVWFCMHHLLLQGHIVEVCAVQVQHSASLKLKPQPPPRLTRSTCCAVATKWFLNCINPLMYEITKVFWCCSTDSFLFAD
jgi:hypothetical protein